MTEQPQTRHVHIVRRLGPSQYAVTDASYTPAESLFLAGGDPAAIAQREHAARFREPNREQEWGRRKSRVDRINWREE
ncbi:MAG: hypothetical protein LC793_13125 [Thermomicrobia bacterium]|nr:hypothetical protein [Thermomicrobia bacterium]MCA1723330.1 hypothetical protein [Thermomicrobia bacterium]